MFERNPQSTQKKNGALIGIYVFWNETKKRTSKTVRTLTGNRFQTLDEDLHVALARRLVQVEVGARAAHLQAPVGERLVDLELRQRVVHRLRRRGGITAGGTHVGRKWRRRQEQGQYVKSFMLVYAFPPEHKQYKIQS